MKKRLWIAAMAVIMAGAVTQAEPVVYQSDFTGADLASAGLTQEQFDASSTWILNTTSNRVESDFAGTTDRSTLYTIDSWQNTGGFTLDVTFMHAADGVRFSFGLVDADWTVLADDWVDYHSAYGIGITLDGSTAAGGDGLAFSDGSASGLLSTDQGDISLAVEHTLSMRVTSTGWS